MINHPDPVHAFMKTELTERYIWAVVRRLPQTQRPEIERELRSVLAAKIDEHVAAGADPMLQPPKGMPSWNSAIPNVVPQTKRTHRCT